jgi:hypothetical protein
MAGVLLLCEGSKDGGVFLAAGIGCDSGLGAVWQPAMTATTASVKEAVKTPAPVPSHFSALNDLHFQGD